MHAGLSQSYDKTERSARPSHSERANATVRLSRRSGVTRLQSPRCGRMPRDDASCRCLLTRRLGRTWKYRSNRLHELKASALGSWRYIQSTGPQSSIPSYKTINQQRLTSQTTLLTFTYTHIHKSQYLISAIDQPQIRLISTYHLNNTFRLNPPQPRNNAFLRLGTAFPRQVHRRLFQTCQPSITVLSTKNLIACSPAHDFGIHRSPTTAQRHRWKDIESSSTSCKHYICGTMSNDQRT